jgi:hypothetical protein
MHTMSLPHPGVAAYATSATLGVLALWLAWWLNKHVARNLANLPMVSREGAKKADPIVCYIVLSLDLFGALALAGTVVGSWVNSLTSGVDSLTHGWPVAVPSVIATVMFLMILTHVLLHRDVKSSTRWYARTLPFIATTIPGAVGVFATAAVGAVGAVLDTVLGRIF